LETKVEELFAVKINNSRAVSMPCIQFLLLSYMEKQVPFIMFQCRKRKQFG